MAKNHVCDGLKHCRDTSDEFECDEKKTKGRFFFTFFWYFQINIKFHWNNSFISACKATDIKCSNGRCVDRSMFCNQKNDCGLDDNTDEPSVCSCYTYLR